MLYWAAEGDSITAGTYDAVGAYPGVFNTGYAKPNARLLVNNAVGNSTVTTMSARAATLDARVPAVKGSDPNHPDKYALSILIGVNDWYTGVSTATHLTQLATYIDARIAARWDYIVLCTHTPDVVDGTVGGLTFDSWRTTVEATYATWVGGRVTSIADFHADPVMGPNAAASDTLLYSDGVHPTNLGQTNLEAVIRPKILALIPT